MHTPTHIIYRCDEIIMKSEGEIKKIRSKIMILRDNNVYAVCKSCGTEVQVPLTTAPISQPNRSVGPPLILRNR